jgi:putative ABC transport system permease protein
MKRAIFLLSLGVRRARATPGRSALVVVGVALGVALMVTIRILNSAAAAALGTNLGRLATRIDLSVTREGIGLSPDLSAQLEGVPGVAAAFPVVEGTVFVDQDDTALMMLGLDLPHPRIEDAYASILEAREVGPRGVEHTVLSGSVLIPFELASRLGLGIGSTLRVQGPHGATDLVVGGLLRLRGVGRAVAEQLIVADLDLAARTLGRSGPVDRIDIQSDRTVALELLTERLRARIPEGAIVAQPREDLAFRFRLATAFLDITSAVSVFGLIVGFFLIYNVLSAAIIAEAGELARLRLQGASRRDLLGLLVAQAVMQALPGIALGSALGVALAVAARLPFLQGLGSLAQTRLGAELSDVSWPSVLLIAGLGVPTAMGASWLAAHRRVSRSPLQCVTGASSPELARSGARLARRASAALLAAAIALILLETAYGSAICGMLAIAAVSTLLVTGSASLVLPAAKLVRSILARLGSVSASIAADELASAWGRTAVTIAVSVLGIGTATCTATIFRSAESLVLNVLRNHFQGDLVITSAFRDQGWLQLPLDAELAAELRQVDGVGSVETERLLPVDFRGSAVTVRALDAQTEGSRKSQWLFVDGDPDAADAMLAGKGILVSRNFAEHFRIGRGQDLDLQGPDGAATVHVLGVVEDFVSPVGSVIMARRQLAKLTHDALANYISVEVRAGRDVSQVAHDVRRRMADRYRLRMLTVRDFLASAQALIGQVFHFTRALTAIVLLIATAAMLQSVISGALEHRRIFSIMRAIGASRRHLKLTFVIEGATVGVIGGALGVSAGVLLSLLWIPLHLRYLLGWSIPIDWPWRTYVAGVGLGAAWPVLAALGAAQRLARLPRVADLVLE